MVSSIFSKNLCGESVEAAQLVSEWERIWLSLAIKFNIADEVIQLKLSRGRDIIHTLFRQLAPEINVINVKIPWKSTWVNLDAEVTGEIPALLSGSLNGTNPSGFYLVDFVPSYVTSRIPPSALQIYSIPRQAVSREAESVVKNYSVKMQLINLHDATFRSVPTTNRVEVLPLLGVIICQIKGQLCMPTAGSHCFRCPHSEYCSPAHLSNEAVSSPVKTREGIEENNG